MTFRPDLSNIRNNNILVMGKKTNNKPRNRTDNFGWDFDMTVHRSVPPGPPDLTNPPDMDTIRAVSDFNTINTDNTNSVDNKAIVSEEPKLSKEDPQETRHLKELLLLHLEWIQQQQQALLSKDRQIQRLKQEKDALKCRLERMDRRMALLRHKNEPSPQRQSNEHILEERAKTAPATQPTGQGDTNGRVGKRKHSLEPRNLSRRFDSEAEHTQNVHTLNKSTSTDCDAAITTPKRSKQRLSQQISDKWDSPLKQSYLYSQQPPRKCRSHSLVLSEESLPEDNDTEKEGEDSDGHCLEDSDTDDEVQIMDHRSRKRSDSAHSSTTSDEYHLHATDILYYVPVETKLPSWEISPLKDTPEDVRVPTYRVKQVPTGYQMEGTENLTDEAFLKRHQKPEADEKRRKRWDVQMLREQKMLERLQNRSLQATTSKNGAAGTSRNSELEDVHSFLPEPVNARFLEICEDVPVSMFGYTVPKLDTIEFSLPWFSGKRFTNEDRNRLSHGGR